MPKKPIYSEPSSYFPKEIRKKAKIGEYAETEKKKSTTKSKKSKRATK